MENLQNEMEKKIHKTEEGVVIIAQSVYDNTPNDYKGVWDTERYDIPNWDKIREMYIGKRTWMPPFDLFGHSCLCIEGRSLTIVSDEEFDTLTNKNSLS